uniref:Uncharacterized protein n=1 Tax=Romanomermis culicivorax TaxID=13658 RepID=A0A915IGI0_ROMCU
MIAADNKTFEITHFVIIGSLTFLGGCFNTSLSTGSTPKLLKIYMLISSKLTKYALIIPLRRRSVHDDIYPQNLHSVQRRLNNLKPYGVKIIVDQNHIGRFFANIGTAFAHSNPYISFFQCYGVIHAVAGHGDTEPNKKTQMIHNTSCVSRSA